MTYALITAGAYIPAELQAEFGPLPPSFLPLGARRLYAHQAEALGGVTNHIVMTLPETFTPAAKDRALLNELNIELIFVPTDLALGESIVFTLNLLGLGKAPVKILHGDTLITPLPHLEGDVLTVHETQMAYQWGSITLDENIPLHVQRNGDPSKTFSKRHVLSGYFSFSNGSDLIRCITRARGDFVKGLNLYTEGKDIHLSNDGFWLDFGHLQTFYRSKRLFTTERAFNNLEIGKKTVEKSSEDHFKMRAEAHWFESVPSRLRLYTPAFLGSFSEGAREGYRTSYEYHTALSELFVFGRLGQPAWEMIFAACGDFLKECRLLPAELTGEKPDSSFIIENLYLKKTLQRLESFARENSTLSIDKPLRLNGKAFPSLLQIAEESATIIPPPSGEDIGIMHGDFCFSNILFDYRSQRIKVIDPRGSISPPQFSILGDRRYDIAKLYHSAAGRYDFIIAGYFDAKKTGETDFEFSLADDANAAFAEAALYTADLGDIDPSSPPISAINVHLFLSMLPLHADRPDRQLGFMCNALRLFSRIMHKE